MRERFNGEKQLAKDIRVFGIPAVAGFWLLKSHEKNMIKEFDNCLLIILNTDGFKFSHLSPKNQYTALCNALQTYVKGKKAGTL